MKKIIFIFLVFIIILKSFFLIKNLFQDDYNYEIFPSNENIFTQGIVFFNDKIHISSGAPEYFPETKSAIGILDKNGNFLEKFNLDKNIFFGEGITIFKNKIYFLTWKNEKGFIFDTKNFKKTGDFSYFGEGWGITNDENKIFMSNGSEKIQIFDENFRKKGEFSVKFNNEKITKINEMEFINGKIYANIWLTNQIIKINPENGQVEKIFNLDFIKNKELNQNQKAQELNGIAFNKEKNQIIITGKMWKNLYIFDLDFFKKKFESNNFIDYSDENFRQKIIFKNDTKLLLEAGNSTHDGCRNGKTILDKNGKQKVIIDDIKYSEFRNLCSVYAQIKDNENVKLFVCYASGAGSGECRSLVFNLNINTEKLSFVGDYSYIPENSFKFGFFEEYFKKYKTKKEQKESLKDLKNTDKSELETSIKWHNEFLEKEKIIKEYFKKEHNIDNIVFEDEFFKEFFKNLK